MMPLRKGRKARKIEKVENICRTATAQSILPTDRYTSDHVGAIPWMPVAGSGAAGRVGPALPEMSYFATEF
jgi:hypothetical protein